MTSAKSNTDWRPFLAEFLGTGLLLLVGLSLVILMFGEDAPGASLIPNLKLRQGTTGFLFGCVGGGIALSPIGKVSGAHINPAVTLGFTLMRKLDARTSAGYILSQLAGAVVGCTPLLLWGSMGRSIDFGATKPGAQFGLGEAMIGEITTTFVLVTSLCIFIAYRKIRNYTPYMIPVLYGIMVPLESDASGTSTNPARSFGPAIVSGQWEHWWIYWVGPLAGMVLAIFVCSFFAQRIEVAKLYHFESDNRTFFGNKSANEPETIKS